MLRELHIQNLAVIEDARVELAGGLNCFTGQTGAGKSLIIGAFEVMLGLRSAGDLLRAGCDEGRVTGLFEVADAGVAAQLGGALDMAVQPGAELLVTRKLFSSGRTSFGVNGQPVTAPMVRTVGELLVDIHGQHDHQYLLKPGNQLLILDEFAKAAALRRRFAELHGELSRLRARRARLESSRALRRQQLDLYTFQAEEIDAADPSPGEYATLQSRHAKLSNIQRLQAQGGQAHAALYETDGSIVERLHALTHVLLELAELDDELRDTGEQVRAATLSLQDAAFDLGRYVDRLELDPGELGVVEERLNLLNRLVAKYGEQGRRMMGDGWDGGEDDGSGEGRSPAQEGRGLEGRGLGGDDDPIGVVIGYREWLRRQVEQLRGDDDDLGAMAAQAERGRVELREVGAKLSAARRRAAGKLAPLIEAQLAELGMAEARFEVAIQTAGDDAALDEARSSGLDDAEFLVRTNPGQPARPLRKIASGGELSRIMLALKSIFAQSDRISVLVFDEIDANIGGRMGTVIGQKLRRLARDGGQQVLCITHLPQIAAFADRHLRIAKAVTGKGKSRRTATSVEPLDGQSRIAELAEMLAGSGASATTQEQAKEMLAAAGG